MKAQTQTPNVPYVAPLKEGKEKGQPPKHKQDPPPPPAPPRPTVKK